VTVRRVPIARRFRSEAGRVEALGLHPNPSPRPIEAAILRHLQQVHGRARQGRPVVAADVQGATDVQVGFEIERLRLLTCDSRREWGLSLAGWAFVEQLRLRYPEFVSGEAPDLRPPNGLAT
jgi:hypothetical protein